MYPQRKTKRQIKQSTESMWVYTHLPVGWLPLPQTCSLYPPAHLDDPTTLGTASCQITMSNVLDRDFVLQFVVSPISVRKLCLS